MTGILETEQYKVKAGTFEGPLDLLLSLIESRKLFINEISLVEVTADYISHIKALPKYEMHDATSFLLIASTLILIKSRSLLPNLALTDEEEEKIIDLEARLKLYQAVKDASVFVKERFGKQLIFQGPYRSSDIPVFVPDKGMTLENMRALVEGLINNLPKTEPLQEVTVRKVLSIEEMIDDITERVQKTLSLRFSDLARHPSAENAKEEKVYVIVSFLAMLELVREGLIDVMQQASFGDMEITKQEASLTPIEE